MAIVALALLCMCSAAHADPEDRIQPYSENPFYWQYKGEPVLLLGGSFQDNLFNHPTGPPDLFPPDGTLESHLDLLVSVGGNYVRNTMSHRDQPDAPEAWHRLPEGQNVYLFVRLEDGRFDLDQPNPEYWGRFENFLRMTGERDIIVQIEVWAFHDFFRDDWPEYNPWNPENNVNYTTENTMLQADYGGSMERILRDETKHDFFFSVPALNNDRVLLGYQQQFVDRILEYSLDHPHVLYCITNEIHPYFSKEWGFYWEGYLRERAEEAGRDIEIAEMYFDRNLSLSPEHTEPFTYIEASMNHGRWDQLMEARAAFSNKPKPINNVKIFGGVQGFWRNLIGGCASMRFHRTHEPPATGLGLSQPVQANIRSARMLTDRIDIFAAEPRNDLLSDAGTEAYCAAEPGMQYTLCIPNGGSVQLDMRDAEGEWTLTWLHISESKWSEEETVEGGDHIEITAPNGGQWAAAIVPAN